MIIYCSIIISLNIIILLFHKNLTELINIYDKPDKIRKFHQFPVAISGGFIICINFIVFIIFLINFENQSFNLKNIYSFFIVPLVLFFLGLYDDKRSIKAKKKLFILTIIIISTLLVENNLLITSLSFYFLDKTFFLNSTFSLFFSALCILLFINALNMYDGVNLQVSFYCLILFVFFLIKDFNFILSITIIISLIFFIILNFQSKSFLGDGGVYLLAYLISYVIISNYNLKNSIKIEEIFILMLIPGLDMFRLFIERLYARRSPFDADRNHIHHILIKKFNCRNQHYIFTISTIFTFLIYFFYMKFKSIYIVFIFILFYLFAVFYKNK